MKTSDVLQAARQLLIDEGWCQGQLVNDCGQYCSLGAINAVDQNDIGLEAKNALRHILSVGSVGLWNDAPGRTVVEVLALYDDAISLALTEEALDDA